MKYREYHRECAPCPPASAQSVVNSIQVYRFGKYEAVSRSDFDPPAVLNPRRGFKSNGEKCSAYALSYFDSEQNLRRQYEKLKKTSAPFARKLRSVIQSTISSDDGLATSPDSSGHFDLHESTNANLSASSVIIGDL